jgi:hypothetical protein
MTALQPRYRKEEFARRGDEIYERDIGPKLKPNDEDKFVLIKAWRKERRKRGNR